MIPRYEYVMNPDEAEGNPLANELYFKKCKFSFRDGLILENPKILFGTYMYYEAIQAIIAAKIVTLSEGENTAERRKEIESLASLQSIFERFQTNFLILFFADGLASAGRLNGIRVNEFEKNFDKPPFGELLEMMCGGENLSRQLSRLYERVLFRKRRIEAVRGHRLGQSQRGILL